MLGLTARTARILCALAALIAVARAACPDDCPQGSGYHNAQWSCCDVPSDKPLCDGQTRCNDDTQSSCCGVTTNPAGTCYRLVRCWGGDSCAVTTCGSTESNPVCYNAASNSVCERQANGCTVEQLYDPRYTICCGGNLWDNTNWACCAGVAYEVANKDCCNGVVVPEGQCGGQPSASSTRPPAPSASSTRPPAPSASSTRPPAPSASSTPPPTTTCAANCRQSRGWAPAGGWSCCDFGGSLDHPLCDGEDRCYDDAQSSCCGVALDGNCYRVVRCWGDAECLPDNGCTAQAPVCYDPATTSVCESTENGCTSRELYDPSHTICCGGELYDKLNWACCQGTPFRPAAQDCCPNGSVSPNGGC